MRQEFEGVGKEGMTEVRVNVMATRGRREGIPVFPSYAVSDKKKRCYKPFVWNLEFLFQLLSDF